MKVLFMSLGTRGDIEPFLSMAEMLNKEGHEIHCLFPEQFRTEIIDMGYGFYGFDKAFLDLLNSKTGKSVMGGGNSFFGKVKNYGKLIKSSLKLQGAIIDAQRSALQDSSPEKVIFHPKCLFGYIAAMDDPDRFTLLSPIPCINHPSKDFPHIGLAKWGPFSPKWNLLSYKIINGIRYRMTKKMVGKYYSDFPETDFSTANLKEFEEKSLQTIYPISKFLFPRPKDWPETAKILGYLPRDQSKNYTPDPELVEWLSKYPKAILMTFGSMSNPKPKLYSETLIKCCEKLGIPAIVNTSWGGLQKVTDSKSSIFYVNSIPYDWILPKMYGVIHHGGSGTTHSTALNACVQLIIPHIIDQYFWNQLVVKQNLGPSGIPVHRLNEEKLIPILSDFWNNSSYSSTASEVSEKMKKEVNKAEILKLLN